MSAGLGLLGLSRRNWDPINICVQEVMADPLVTDPQETVKKLLHKALKAGVDKGRLTNIKTLFHGILL